MLRRFEICSSVTFGSGPPFQIFIVCVVTIFYWRSEICSWLCLSLYGLLIRQKGFGYVLCLETPLPKYTETLSCVEFCSAAPVIRFLTEFSDRNDIFDEFRSI